jgi:hypothetical protein
MHGMEFKWMDRGEWLGGFNDTQDFLVWIPRMRREGLALSVPRCTAATNTQSHVHNIQSPSDILKTPNHILSSPDVHGSLCYAL